MGFQIPILQVGTETLPPPQATGLWRFPKSGLGDSARLRSMSTESPGDSGQMTPAAQNALEELVSYLSDQIPPLFFAGSFEDLLPLPPRMIVAQIVGWATRQMSPGGPLPTADYLFHAAKKIHMLSELELVSDATVKEFINNLRQDLVAACPAADRVALLADLDRLDMEVGVGTVGEVNVVYRRAGAAGEGKTQLSTQTSEKTVRDTDLSQASKSLAKGLRKLDLLLSGLGGVSEPGATTSSKPDVSIVGQLPEEIVAQLTSWVQSKDEMEQLFRELGNRGYSLDADQLLERLVERLPDWAPPTTEPGGTHEAPQSAVRAMSRVVSMAPDKAERHRRYAELVERAVSEFNKGSLGRAVTLLDLATSMVERKEVEGMFADSVQRQVYGKLNMERLQEISTDKDSRQLLHRVLSFFRLLSPAELLRQLDGEPDRNRRKFLLDLLRVHQSDARQVAFAELTDAHTGGKVFHWYYVRNLVHLLRTIPRDPGSSEEEEIEVLTPLTGLENPPPLIREALAAFGQLSHGRAVTNLAARVNEVEGALTTGEPQSFTVDQLVSLLDSMLMSLVKIGTADSRRCVVAHGLKRNAKLGNTLERMTWLGDQDLSREKDIVNRLVGEIRNELPRGFLGRSKKKGKRQRSIDALVRTLSATKSAQVLAVLKEIRDEHSTFAAADTAAEILSRGQEAAGEKAEKLPTLSGDLALFGLPNLLQNLADSQLGGLLKVLGSGGGITARVWMRDGQVLAADSGNLRAEVVVYQLLEDPKPGQFVFAETDEQPDSDARTQEPMSVQSVLFEGIRRYDEFKQAAALVPDKAILSPTGSKPTPAEGETDGDLVREVWRRASSGFSPAECEADIAIDRYRIRRLYEHWLTEGSLAFSETNA